MREVFADTHFWVALLMARDPWHASAVRAYSDLGSVLLVTTDSVLVELLNYMAGYGPATRDQGVHFARGLLGKPAVEVLPCSREGFLAGLSLYASRRDKGYSLTDCMSMETMRSRGIAEVLTNDRHFAQEGFVILLAT